MSNVPADLRYTREHEWARQEGNRVRVGITAYAQEQLGDVVFVELPEMMYHLFQRCDGAGHALEIKVIRRVRRAMVVWIPVRGGVSDHQRWSVDAPK